MNILGRISQWLLPPGRKAEENAIIVPNYRVATGEYQPENVRAAIEAYIHDTDIFNAINFISNTALSEGFYVTGDQQYLNGSNRSS